MSNDTKNYPEDSFENMINFAKIHKFESINYLIDETQKLQKNMGLFALLIFFGYNKNLELQYRGRFKRVKRFKPINNEESDLKLAMKLICETQKGPANQIPSMGCNIKWVK